MEEGGKNCINGGLARFLSVAFYFYTSSLSMIVQSQVREDINLAQNSHFLSAVGLIMFMMVA